METPLMTVIKTQTSCNLFLLQGIPRPEKIHNPSIKFYVLPGMSYQWEMLGIPPNVGVLINTSINSFAAKGQQLKSKLLLDDRTLHPVFKAEPSLQRKLLFG